MRTLLCPLGLLVVSMLAGCAAHRDPIVVVSGVTVGERSDEALRLDIALELDNPNTQSLRLSEFEYELIVDGARAYQGKRSAEATLASTDHREVVIPAIIRLSDVGWWHDAPRRAYPTRSVGPPSIRYAIRGELTYVAPGELSRTIREMGFPAPRSTFSAAGELPLH